MKKLFFSVVLLTVLANAYSQSKNLVFLKNGSQLKGKVLQNDTTGVILKMRDGNTWHFPADDVAAVYVPERTRVKVLREFEDGRVGFYNRTSVGGTLWGPAFHAVVGYSFNSHWELGLGLGVERYWNNHYIPVCFEGRYYFLSIRNSPFVAINIGQAFLPEYRDPGGFTGSLFAGYDFYLFKRCGFMASAGYSFAHPVSYGQWYNDFGSSGQVMRMEIRLGLIFR